MYSPDLNPIEKFWSWLGKELRRRDLKDLREGRPVLGKIAYRLRVKAVLRSPKSQQVASRCAGTLKKVCKAVVAKIAYRLRVKAVLRSPSRSRWRPALQAP